MSKPLIFMTQTNNTPTEQAAEQIYPIPTTQTAYALQKQ